MHKNLLINDNHLRWSDVAKKMESNNKLKILNILGGSRQGGAERFFERLSFAIEKKKIDLQLVIRKDEKRFSLLREKIKKFTKSIIFIFLILYVIKKLKIL